MDFQIRDVPPVPVSTLGPFNYTVTLGWHCGVAGKAATCSTTTPHGRQFNSWLLHFQFASLLMTREKQKMAQMVGLLPPARDLEEAPVSGLS